MNRGPCSLGQGGKPRFISVGAVGGAEWLLVPEEAELHVEAPVNQTLPPTLDARHTTQTRGI